MPKSSKLLLGFGALLLIGVLVGAVLARTLMAQASTGHCGSKGVVHQVTIQNDQVSPQFTDSKVCDTIQFTNQDAVPRMIAFGSHEEHTSYNGITERLLDQHQSFSLILNQAGQFHFHDHNHDEVMGYYNVSK